MLPPRRCGRTPRRMVGCSRGSRVKLVPYQRGMASVVMAVTLLLGGDRGARYSTGDQPITFGWSERGGSSVLESAWGTAEREPGQTDTRTVRQTEIERFKQQLVSLGIEFSLLRENWNHILRRNNAPISRAQEEAVANAKRSAETLGVTVMRAPEAAVAEYALTAGSEDKTSRILIPISDDQQVTIVRDKFTRTGKGVIWRGTVEDTGESAVLLWWKDGRLTGLFGHKAHIYMVMNMGGDLHAVLEVDPSTLPPDHPNITADTRRAARPTSHPQHVVPDVAPISPAVLKALEQKTIVIDVMMLYTKRAADHYMLHPADVLEVAIERVNETFRNSGVGNVSLRLVHTQSVDYDERGFEELTDLYRMVDGDGAFRDVRRMRDEMHADIVGLVVDDPRGCGLSTRVAPDAEDAYFVVHYSCAAITISIAHEIGHILGARHDRNTDPSNLPFAYGHGYVNGTKWRDIMSYGASCDGCLRIPFWSNPRVLYKGEPTGTLSEDNVRVILEQAERVANFR
jgi:hypothetical protein